jgi:hypothetical protein
MVFAAVDGVGVGSVGVALDDAVGCDVGVGLATDVDDPPHPTNVVATRTVIRKWLTAGIFPPIHWSQNVTFVHFIRV